MRWPNTLASKVLSGYFHLKYDLRASDLRRFNPPMGAMPFFNNSASPQIRHAELAMVASSILKFLQEVGVPTEPKKTVAQAQMALLAVLEVEDCPSSNMVTVIDEHYRFTDEPVDA
jgi:hypothetical protein